jgi:putative redox protein
MAQAPSALAPSGESVVVDDTGLGKFQVEARMGSTALLIDEPASVGGLGSGPNPYDLMSAALGACTLMTIRLYAERKAWPLQHVRVRVTHSRGALQAKDVFAREISLQGPLDAEQTQRLLEIAERCPVHLTLERDSEVTTRLVDDAGPLAERSGTLCEHMRDMDEACA